SGLDPRTGLALPSLVRDRLDLALHRARRLRRQVAVLALELDGIEDLSEPLSVRSSLLFSRAMADRIRLCIREMDTAGRINAASFIVVLEDLESGAMAAQVAKRLLAAM